MQIARLSVSWGDRTGEILKRSVLERLAVEVVYAPPVSSDRNNLSKIIQLVDVYDLAENYFVGYSHLFGRIETFEAGRVSAIKITEKAFEVPATFDAMAYWNNRTLF